MGQEIVGNDIKLISTKELNLITSSVFQARGGYFLNQIKLTLKLSRN